MDTPTVLSLVSTTAFLFSVIFAGMQVRNALKQRSREASTQLMHTVVTPEFLKTMRFVLTLPDGLSKQEIEERLSDQKDILFYFLGTCESLGILVYRREIAIDLIADLLGVTIYWDKLCRYVIEYRKELKHEGLYEWFQWLAEQVVKQRSKQPHTPAYIAFREWHP
jgi:hypothetical protein